ncbi:hypothetical protein GF407_17320 [candidate division KSB1 bacterium]|nr:hypothetical protein [candidate division KSB1 bacterium]
MKRALGIFVDEFTLKAALLSHAKGGYQIEKMETFQLAESLEPKKETKLDSQELEEGFEFDLDSEERTNIKESETHSNLDAIIKILNQMTPHNTGIAFTLSDAYTMYKAIPNIFEKKDSKIKLAIWQDFHPQDHGETNLEGIGFVPVKENTYLGMAHEDPLILADLFHEAGRLMKISPPQIKRIDTTEFSLAYSVSKAFPLQGKSTAVVYFSQNYTKIFFMQEDMVISVLPAIHEGASSETVCETAFSKILFELDSGNISALNNIILAGELDTCGAEKVFTEKFSDVNILRFKPPATKLAPYLKNQKQIASYAVSISLAIKVLDKKIKRPYHQNFLPKRVYDKSALYKISWHGFLLMIFLFIGALFLTIQTISNFQTIRKERNTERHLNNELSGLAFIATQVDSLRHEINILKNNTALIDSMNQHTTRWSPAIEALSEAYEKVGPFVLVKIETTTNKLTAEVIMKNRDQVARMERFINNSILSHALVEENNPNYLAVKLECLLNK